MLQGGVTIDPWTLGQNYAEKTATVGSTITFTWTAGTHGVYRIPDKNCPTTFANGQNEVSEVMAPTPGPTSAMFKFTEPGVYWFACPVDGHCDGGMKVKVTVS